jgi:hypothetical protein
VQAPRQRIRGSHIDAVKSSKSQKKVQAAEKAALLQEGVDAIIQVRDNAIEELAEKLSIKPKAIHVIINGKTHYTKSRRPNTFNALVHKTMIDMNDGLFYFSLFLAYQSSHLCAAGLGHGECFKLKEIQDVVRDGINNDTYSQDIIDEAVEELEQSRKTKSMGARSSNTAAYADARSTTQSLSDEVGSQTILSSIPR